MIWLILLLSTTALAQMPMGGVTFVAAGSCAATGCTDSFGGTLSNWTQWRPGTGVCAIASGHLHTTTVGASLGCYYSAVSFDNDQYAQITIPTMPAASHEVGVFVQAQGSDATRDGYRLNVEGNANPRNYSLMRWDNGSITSTLKSGTQTFNNGDMLRLEIVGTTLRMYRCTPTCTQFGTDATDGTPLTGGYPGVSFFNNSSDSAIADDFEGGNCSALGSC